MAGGAEGQLTPPCLAIVGRSGAGKTTLLEGLVAELSRRGLRVATLKHTHHELEDRAGSDSARHRAAGAVATGLAGPAGVQLWGWEPPVEQLLSWLGAAGADLILIEGYKRAGLPRLEVARDGQPMLPLEELWGLATDHPRDGVKCFKLNDYKGLADALNVSDMFTTR